MSSRKSASPAQQPVGSQADIEATRAQLEAELAMSADTFWQRINGFMPKFTFEPTSWQATYLKLVARVSLYAFGAVATICIMGTLSVAMQTAGWPVLIIMMIEIIGLVLGCIGAWMLSDSIVNYIADGNVSRDIKRVGGWVKRRVTGVSTFAKQRMAMH